MTGRARNLDVIEVDGLGAHRERQLVPVARRALVVRRRVLEQVGPEGSGFSAKD